MADVVVHMSADESKLWKAQQKVIEQGKKMEEGLANVGRKGKDAFGSTAVGQMAGYVSGMVSVSAALSFVKRGISDVIAEGERLAAKQKGDVTGLGPLLQLAVVQKDPQKAMRRYIEEATKTQAEGGAETLGEAGTLQFTLASTQLEKYRRTVAMLKKTGAVTDPDKLLGSLNALRVSVGGEFKDLERVMNIGLGASSVAKAQIDELMAAAALIVPIASQAGIGPKDVAAAIASISNPAMGPEVSKTLVENFEKGVIKTGIPGGFVKPGGTIGEQVADVTRAIEAGNTLEQVLGGRAQAWTGYGLLAKGETGPLYEQAKIAIEQAIANNAFALIEPLAMSTPELSIPLAGKVATAKKEIAGTEAGRRGILETALIEDTQTKARERGQGDFTTSMEWTFGQGIRWLSKLTGDDNDFLRNNMSLGSPETQEEIRKFLEEIANNTRGSDAPRQRAAAAAVAE